MLFVLHVCMLRECEDDGYDGVRDGVGVVAVSACLVQMLCLLQTTCQR